ncbi:unnamed protein product [Peronospora belbahrii]|uniref:PX domain-containing protein n=1 Tax=Peronospora belbahrii TaxID=622444 RepID=A0AAU9L3L5_9STRA|nr:unnamed protein product [Peronospora belbahrii]CAH0519385.1 unnamed protein product [Peronospora belbahrii]
MSVKHTELDLTWRHARSFDEYRKLQQRLLKKLQHGHFCDADCPWLYGFLKSYFPKKLVFTISSARVVEQRKETLERFFSALNGFLIDKKNLSCSVLTTVFADELVKFIYEDALQQYGLENPIKSTVLEKNRLTLTGRNNLKWKEPVTPMKKRLLECESKQQQQYDRSSLLTNSTMDSITDDNIVNDLNSGNCGICGSPLCGVAHGNSPSSTEVGGSPFSENTSNNNSSVFSLPWSRTPTTNGSRRSGNANDFGGSRRSKGSASRRRAATYYLTTLSCSHQFHDECIVPKLNEALECPTCGRIQTKL